MDKIQSNISAILFEKREFVHKLAFQIEQIGLSDEQRGLLLIDLSRCFENQELAASIFLSLKEHLDETIRIGREDDSQCDQSNLG
jgi:hypothetical protein